MASLGNMLLNPHIGLIMIDFTHDLIGLHINGDASIVTPARMKEFDLELPEEENAGRKAVEWVLINVTEAYVHCSKRIPKLIPASRAGHWGTDNPRPKGNDFFGVQASKVVPAGNGVAATNGTTMQPDPLPAWTVPHQNGHHPAQANGQPTGSMNGHSAAQANGHVPAQANGHVPAQANGHVPAQANGHVPAQANGHVPALAGGFLGAPTFDQPGDQASGRHPDQANGHQPSQANGHHLDQTAGSVPVRACDHLAALASGLLAAPTFDHPADLANARRAGGQQADQAGGWQADQADGQPTNGQPAWPGQRPAASIALAARYTSGECRSQARSPLLPRRAPWPLLTQQ